MGDTDAVTVLEMAHRRQLVNAGVLRTDSLLIPERPLPQGNDSVMVVGGGGRVKSGAVHPSISTLRTGKSIQNPLGWEEPHAKRSDAG